MSNYIYRSLGLHVELRLNKLSSLVNLLVGFIVRLLNKNHIVSYFFHIIPVLEVSYTQQSGIESSTFQGTTFVSSILTSVVG